MAKASTKNVLDSIKALTGKGKPATPPKAPENQKIKTGKEMIPPAKPKKVDGRKNNGGKGNVGRKPGGSALARRLIRSLVQDHYTTEVDMKVKDPKTGNEHTIKKPRVLVAIDVLFEVGVQSKDAHALDRYLNRALGKPPQPVVGDEDEDAIQIDLGVDRILDKAYGDDDENKE